MSSYDYFVIFSVVCNVIQFIAIMRLFRKKGEYEDALKNIDGIVSGLKKQESPPPDPRKGMGWKVKRYEE